ncbi:hypothetical protein DWY22_04665 [Heyndrickxia coagulans]|nr:hypothetical protein DWY22_04665 [Heyndrickxia coagulans]
MKSAKTRPWPYTYVCQGLEWRTKRISGSRPRAGDPFFNYTPVCHLHFPVFHCKGQKAFVRTLFALFEEKWRHNANAILLFRCPARHFIQVLLSAFFLL